MKLVHDAVIIGAGAAGLACAQDWGSDPFAKGAYSCWAVGGVDAACRLAKPFGHTLFFAGEHTATDAGLATVHGALQTGRRAAQQVLRQLKPRRS